MSSSGVSAGRWWHGLFSRRAIIFEAVAVALVAVGVTLGLVLSDQGSNTDVVSAADAAQIASVQSGCQQWLQTDPGETGNAQWCTEMAAWMSQYMGRYGLGPQMMWGDPSQLSATCQRWMGANFASATTTDPQAWCNAMAGWMASNVQRWSGRSGWGAWMSGGPMMGR